MHAPFVCVSISRGIGAFHKSTESAHCVGRQLAVMQLMFKNRISRRATCLVLLMMIGMMPGQAAEASSEEAVLKARASEYWAARAVGNRAKSYKFEAGAQPGGGLTPEAYADVGLGLNLSNIRVKSLEIQGEQAIVKLSALLHTPYMPRPFPQEISDPWVKLNGVWYHKDNTMKGATILRSGAEVP